MNQFICIVNPVAGNGRYIQYISHLKTALKETNYPCRFFFTKYAGHAKKIAQQFTKQSDTIISLGGDGTFNEILQGQLSSSASIAIYPCGSGNDIAASLGICLHNAINTILHGVKQSIPLAKVNQHYYFGVACCGFDTYVNKIANSFPSFLRGNTVIYVIAVLLACFSFQTPYMKLYLDDIQMEGKYLLVAVGHGDRYGGGMLITPKADRTDGLLDVCIVKNLNRFTLIGKLLKLMKGQHLHLKEVIYKQVRTIQILGKGSIYADGDYLTNVPASYSIGSKEINILVPSITSSQ
jgi:YegS/Rv2252/BmrU family lipid kinase